MKNHPTKDLSPIPGFHVIEWLREVRDQDAALYTKDPAAYFKALKDSEKSAQKRLTRLQKARNQ